MGGAPRPGEGGVISVAMRQSNRPMADRAAQELKEAIVSGRFVLNLPQERIRFPEDG